MFFFASNCSLSVRQLDVSLNSAEMRSFSSCVRGIHVSVVGCILTVWVTKGAAIAPRIAREIATFHCFMAKSSIRPKRLYNTFGKSGTCPPQFGESRYDATRIAGVLEGGRHEIIDH